MSAADNEPARFTSPLGVSKPEAPKGAIAVVAALVALLVAEMVGVLDTRAGNTLSEWIWWHLGGRHTIVWPLLGAPIAAICCWMVPHFLVGPEVTWRSLLALWASWTLLLFCLWRFGA